MIKINYKGGVWADLKFKTWRVQANCQHWKKYPFVSQSAKICPFSTQNVKKNMLLAEMWQFLNVFRFTSTSGPLVRQNGNGVALKIIKNRCIFNQNSVIQNYGQLIIMCEAIVVWESPLVSSTNSGTLWKVGQNQSLFREIVWKRPRRDQIWQNSNLYL